jgi:hypothetical protein
MTKGYYRVNLTLSLMILTCLFFQKMQAQTNCLQSNFNQVGVSVNRVITDTANNIYVTGQFSGTLNIGTFQAVSQGGIDIFVAKLNSCGVIQWLASGGSTANDNNYDVGQSIAVSNTGDIALVINYKANFIFRSPNSTLTNIAYTSTSNSNHEDGAILKLNSSGNCVWSASVRGTSNDYFRSVIFDKNNNIICTGGFNGCCPSSFTANIVGPLGTTSINSSGDKYGNGFLVKFNSNGSILWTNKIARRDAGMVSVGVDTSSNIYVTGVFYAWSNGTAGEYTDASNTINNLYNPGIGLSYLVKVNSNGNFIWGRTFGNNGNGTNELVSSSSVIIAQNSRVIIAGYYSGPYCNFFNGSTSVYSLPSAATNEGLIASWDLDGNFQWSKAITGSGECYLTNLTLNNNDIVASGNFNGVASNGITNITSNGSTDGVIASIKSDGTNLLIENFGSSGDDRAISTTKHSSGLLVSGIYSSGLLWNATTTTGSGGFWGLKLTDSILPTQCALPSNLNNGLVAYYPFCGNANDASGNGHNGSVFGNVSLVNDRYNNPNKAYGWPSNGDANNYIDIGNLQNNVPNSISISAWIYMNGGYVQPRVISMGESGIQTPSTSNTSRYFNAAYDLAGAGVWPSTYSIPALSWHHIVFTANHVTKTGKFYVDGNMVDSQCCGIVGPIGNNNWNIGRKAIAAYDSWGGYLDDIGIWNRVLTAAEVAQLYTGSTLPVSLLNFSAKEQAGNIQLNWQTENAINFSHFEIEHSVDGINFKQIAFLSSSEKSYLHYKPTATENYYRLKMVDKDGKFSYSSIVKVQIKKNLSVQVYPNPVKDITKVTVNSNKVQTATIFITDAAGKTIFKENKQLLMGLNDFTINTSLFIVGVYDLSVVTDSNKENFKIIKL